MPPLSSDVRNRVQAIVNNLKASRADEETVYTSCICNCGGISHCVFKAHVKDGVVTRVEPDDRYNPNVGMEDKELTDDDLIRNRLQRRPCAMGLVFHKYLYQRNRILYPLKRTPKTKRGEGSYVRISWDEALSIIADKMNEIREKHGPYSIITPYMPNNSLARLFEFWGAGVDSWGWCSWDAARLTSHVMAGAPGWEYAQYASGSATDMLANSKLIVLWGFDPTVGHCGPAHQFAWFIKLARERGKPVIIIDPRYTMAAEVLADQWIPIKPGTDCAMFLAMAWVLFKENLCDMDFIAKYVEPTGLEKWKNYIMGLDDGVEKTPEWAEKICAVPAETIRELAMLVGKMRPAWLWCHWAVSRKSEGEQTVKAFAALQAILGYWGTPGAGPVFTIGPDRGIPTNASWGAKGPYKVPKMYRSHYWAQAVLLLEKVQSGELSESEYMRMVGWKADSSLLRKFNPKMLFWGGGDKPHASDHLVTATDSTSDQVKALNKMEFIVSMHSTLTPTASYADIILPAQDWMWEEKNIAKSDYGGFESINYCPGVVKPAGEVKPWLWVYIKLAEKLGINPRDYFKYYTTDENWEVDYERYLKDSYQNIVEYYAARNTKVPSWDQFISGSFINCDELDEKPFTGWDEQIREGKPFKTASGKIEIYSNYVANERNKGKGEHFDTSGRCYDNLPSDWSDLNAMPVFQHMTKGMSDPLVEKYPLLLLTSHARHRVHYLFWNHPWLRGDVYRHRVWLNFADAKARNIKDDDFVRAYNDRGQVVMRAYVTSRIMPGVALIHQGGRYEPNSSGVDYGASPSTLLGGDFKSCITAAKATTLVQVERFKDE